MKFRRIYQSGKILGLSALLLTASCKKAAIPGSPSPDAAAASLSDSSTVADNAYNDVLVNAFFGYSDELANSSSSLHDGTISVNGSGTEVNRAAYLSCASYTLQTTGGGYPKTLTLDFGNGCSGSMDGILRKGKIIYVFSGSLFTPGTTISATFDHYYVNGYGLQGTCSITNSSDVNGISFTTSVTNGIFTFPDLTNFHYSGNRVVKITEGSSTPTNPLDDVYSLTGNSNFSASDGSSLVATISTPLTWTFVCPHISSGIISFVYNQELDGSIDFGDGTCDDTATLTVGSINRQITLR